MVRYYNDPNAVHYATQHPGQVQYPGHGEDVNANRGDTDEEVVDQWQILFDEEGYQYFYNATTGHSQWEDPRLALDDVNEAAASD